MNSQPAHSHGSFGLRGVPKRSRRAPGRSCGVGVGDGRAASGITSRSGSNPCLSEDIPGIPPPFLPLDFSVRRVGRVFNPTSSACKAETCPNPGNEQKHGRPAGTIGRRIQYARGGVPTDESCRLVREIDTESPSFHEVSESAPITMAYRGRYVSKALKFGPYGDPVVCTVNV